MRGIDSSTHWFATVMTTSGCGSWGAMLRSEMAGCPPEMSENFRGFTAFCRQHGVTADFREE